MTKNVHYDDTNMCTYHCGAVMDFDEAMPSDIWYQHTDLQQMKKKAMAVAKEANRYGLGALLTNTYGRPTKETQDSLTTWSTNGSSRRGLERFINDEYSTKRSEIRKRTIKSVLRAQRKMKEEGVTDVDYSMKVLSRLSEAFSQDSRNFASMMGIADEVASKDTVTSCQTATTDEDENVPMKKIDVDDNSESMKDANNCHRSNSPNSVIKGPGAVRSPVIRPIQKRNLGLSGDARRPTNDLRHYC